MRARLHALFGSLVLSSLFIAGCASTPKPEPTPVAGPAVDFRPASSTTAIAMGTGRYPNLFSPGSSALWVDEAVARAKLELEELQSGEVSPMLAADGVAITRNYYVVELNLVSQFPDSSIAYDVVGLRTVDVYLSLPDGSRVFPVQRVLGSTAQERSVGALKVFGRTNVVAFPKTDVLLGQPTIPNGTAGVQLVLDGFNSTYHFEWAAAPSSAPPAPPAEQSRGMTFSGLFERLRELSRMTQ